jgi:hypothetical protein
VARLEKGSHGSTPDRGPIHVDFMDCPVFSGVRVQADRGAIRYKKEFAELRHGDEIIPIHYPGGISREPDHAVVRVFIDLAAAVGIEHEGDVIKTSHNHVIFTSHHLEVKPEMKAAGNRSFLQLSFSVCPACHD